MANKSFIIAEGQTAIRVLFATFIVNVAPFVESCRKGCLNSSLASIFSNVQTWLKCWFAKTSLFQRRFTSR